jgi:hypothetical protein
MLIAEEEKESKLRHELDIMEEVKEKNKKKKNKEALIDELVCVLSWNVLKCLLTIIDSNNKNSK